MYHIVIAEDETQVRKQIVNHINGSNTEYFVTGEAEDGLQALEVLKEVRPDILLTDICMPKMSGLELIRSVREIDPELPIVVISGYDEFEYARQAMSMGVREYLLKPFRPQKLFNTLDRTKALLLQTREARQNLLDMTQELKRNVDFARGRFFRQFTRGQGSDQEYRKLAGEIGFDLDADWYCAGILGLDVPKQDTDRLMGEVLSGYIQGTSLNFQASRMEDGKLLIFFSKHEGSRERCLMDVQAVMEQVCLSLREEQGMEARCVLGSVYNRYESLRRSIQEAQTLWRLEDGRGKLVQTMGMRLGKGESGESAVEEESRAKLLLRIQLGDSQRALAMVGEIIESLSKLHTDQVEHISISLVKTVLAISDVMEKADGNNQVWKDENTLNYLKKHFTDGSLREAKAVLEEYVLKCCAWFRRSQQDDANWMVNRIKVFIEGNLGNEKLGLELLAEELHYSPDYVRQLFKGKTGENISDYILRKRMELAAELLRSSQDRIQDIAEKTGYSNQRYFASCFKKYYRQTPTQYREANAPKE